MINCETHGKDAKEKQVLSDTTVAENNTTFLTNTKLVKKLLIDVMQLLKNKR